MCAATESKTFDPRHRVLQLLDVVVYAIVVVTLTILTGWLIALVFGNGWVRVKEWLFLAGWLLFGLGTLKMRPKSAWRKHRQEAKRQKLREQGEEDVESLKRGMFGFGGGTAFRERDEDQEGPPPVTALGLRLLPERFALSQSDRLHEGVRLFFAGIAVLATSFVMEFVFGFY